MATATTYPIDGSCNCGRVTYQVTEPFTKQVACHCIDCQKHTQSAFSLVGLLPAPALRILTGELKKWTKTADSGTIIDCFFCPGCGNRIYHASAADPDNIRLKLGTLDDTRVIEPEVHIWTRSKQDWYPLPPGVRSHETQPG